MSGIIFGNMMSGLGQGVANYGSMMERERAMEEERAMRLALQRERDQAQEERLRLTQAARAPAGRERLTLEPGSDQETMIAARMGKSVPELRQLLQATKTGDFSAYGNKVDVMERQGVDELDVSGDTSDAVSRGTAKLVKTERTEFSPKWESEKREMLEKLGREMAGLTYGKDYKDIAEGQDTASKMDNRDGIIAGRLDAGRVADATISAKGEDRFKGGEKSSTNVSTGKQELNELGKSEVRENNAQAGSASASAAKARAEVERIRADVSDGGAVRPQQQERLNSIINSQNATIKSLIDGGRGKTEEEKRQWQERYDLAVQLRDEAQQLLRQSLAERSSKSPAAAPAPSPAARNSGDNKGIVKPDLAKVGAPPGSTLGAQTAQGWEVKDKSGKVIGHIR